MLVILVLFFFINSSCKFCLFFPLSLVPVQTSIHLRSSWSLWITRHGFGGKSSQRRPPLQVTKPISLRKKMRRYYFIISSDILSDRGIFLFLIMSLNLWSMIDFKLLISYSFELCLHLWDCYHLAQKKKWTLH